MNSYNPTSNLDAIFLQSLNPLRLHTNLFPSQTPKPQPQETANGDHRAQILKEERTIEREIIKAITTGKLDSLKPNSGQSVPIGEHYVCVSFHEESDSDCRVWEWHGHVVFYDDENGYTQEYVYGNYFERMMMTREVFGDESDEEDESNEERNLGLGDLISSLSLNDGHLFSRNMGSNSRRQPEPCQLLLELSFGANRSFTHKQLKDYLCRTENVFSTGCHRHRSLYVGKRGLKI